MQKTQPSLTKTLLLIEPKSELREIYSEMFKHRGINPIIYDDPEQALHDLEILSPDGVVWDLYGPETPFIPTIRSFATFLAKQQIPFTLINDAGDGFFHQELGEIAKTIRFITPYSPFAEKVFSFLREGYTTQPTGASVI